MIVGVAVVLYGAVVFARSGYWTSERTAQEPSESPSADVTPTPTPRTDVAGLAACAATLASGDKVIAASRVGVGHWAAHVQTRTDMLTGRITEAQKKANWKRTRLAGPTDQKGFSSALSTYQRGGGCRDVAEVPGGSPAKARVSACQVRGRSQAAAIAAAEAAMDDWARHLADMSKHADRDMSSAMAQKRWVAAWKAAPKNITAFDKADRALAAAPACVPG